MRYNSSDKSGLTNKTSRQQDNYMELANSCQVANYFINNTICCFDCREFCRAEHIVIYDWLTRDKQIDLQLVLREQRATNSLKKSQKSTSPLHLLRRSFTHYYSHYHRHRRRSSARDLVEKKQAFQSHTNLIQSRRLPVAYDSKFLFIRQEHQDSRHNKFYYIKSVKTKFKTNIIIRPVTKTALNYTDYSHLRK